MTRLALFVMSVACILGFSALADEPDRALNGVWRVIPRPRTLPEDEAHERLDLILDPQKALARLAEGPNGMGTGLPWPEYTLTIRDGRIKAEPVSVGKRSLGRGGGERVYARGEDFAVRGWPTTAARAKFHSRTDTIDRTIRLIDVEPGREAGDVAKFRRFAAVYSVSDRELDLSIFSDPSEGGRLIEHLRFVRQP